MYQVTRPGHACGTKEPAQVVIDERVECATGVTPGVADPLLKVDLPGNLDDEDTVQSLV
jgi:hypothetical protein